MATLRLYHISLFLFGLICAYEEEYHGHYTDELGILIDGKLEDLENLAKEHGLTIKRHLSALGNVFVLNHHSLSHRSKRSAEDLIDLLRKDSRVSVVEQQEILKRMKRRIVHDKQWELPISRYDDKSVYQRYTEDKSRRQAKDKIPTAMGRIKDQGFNDPFFPDQWYLINEGQTGGLSGYDVNVLPVWQNGITGKGVVVSILDDGIDHNHPDLVDNYDPEASADMNDREDRDNDPMPNAKDSSNSHGTRCAGEVAARANNSNCGVGIAYNAHIGGVRMLDGTVTDLLEAEALTYRNQYIDIYSSSWGPSDDGKTMEGPGVFAQQALRRGVTEGRGGKGSIYVWATGNGGMVEDDCSCDGYVSSIYTLSVGCISDHGLSTYFSEVCPSTMAVIFTGGAHDAPGMGHHRDNPKIKVVTTDLDGDCTLEFQGTSSAAPLAAGCFALVLEANPDLTWRDMQNIVVQTARIPNAEEEGWTVNGAGYHVNHKFGFGAIDCGKMVEVAQNWETVREQHRCNIQANNNQVDIIAGETVNQTLETSGCHHNPDNVISHLEHVQIHIKLEHKNRGDLSIKLYSPSGTVSEILSIRPLDDNDKGLDFTFMTVHNWGEDPSGVWTLSVTDLSDRDRIFRDDRHTKKGTLKSWSLILWGVEASEEVSEKRSGAGDKIVVEPAHEAQQNEVEDIMAAEEVSSDNLQIVDKSEEKLGQADLELLSDLFSDARNGERKKYARQQKVGYRNGGRRGYKLNTGEYEDLLTEFERILRGMDEGSDRRDNGVSLYQRSLLDDAIAEYFPRKDKKPEQVEKEEEKDEEENDEVNIDNVAEVLDKHSKNVQNENTAAGAVIDEKDKDEELDDLLIEMDELLKILEKDLE